MDGLDRPRPALPHKVEALCQQLGHADWQVRQFALEDLVAWEPRAVASLCRTLAKGDERARLGAAQALIAIGDKSAVPPLCELAQLGDKLAQARALEVLVEIGDASLLPQFQSALSDYDWYVRLAAVVGLAKFGGIEVAVLLRRALMDSHVSVRRAAAEALGNLSDRASLPALRMRLHPLAMEADEVKIVCRRAIRKIEVATEAEKSLPRPVDSPFFPDNLPRLVDVSEDRWNDPPNVPPPNWWARFKAWLRRRVSI
jgi:HEAT repeat protein